MAVIFSIINNKGGTGKTTTTLNLGAALKQQGKKVLIIDFDSQCNLSTSVGIHDCDVHIGQVLVGEKKLNDCIVETDNLEIIPSIDTLLDFEQRINNEPGREYILAEAIAEITDKYDFIIIDCAPSMGTLSLNSLVAADYYIVPMQAENFAFIGLDKILQIAEKVKKRMNPKLELGGVLFVKLSTKTKFSQAVISNLENDTFLKEKIFKTRIRQDIALMEASAFGKTIIEYSQGGRGAHDYKNLAKEILENLKNHK